MLAVIFLLLLTWPLTAGAEPAASKAAAHSVSTLDEWAALFPNPANPPEQKLHIEDLRVSGRNYRFSLKNEASSGQAAGRLLMVFLIDDGQGRLALQPASQFDINAPEANFNNGPGYNIRNSKQISGHLQRLVPLSPWTLDDFMQMEKLGASLDDNRILEMMVVAKSSDGHIVLKKKIRPVE
ncbi:MAG: hypothetical protein LBV79_08375 [Candidatus Adiutrix sp.]|jgi:hypothetical protein|nr:hypothetical protein [Candidatus Adiutrix sp.]